MLIFLKTTNQILMAGVAITALALLLYSLSFNLKDRVARSFAIILGCLVIVYVAESLSSVMVNARELEIWLRIPWIGIVFLPSAYLHFSDAVLATTGKPSLGKRRWAIRLFYLFSLLFLIGLPTGLLIGELNTTESPTPFLEPTWLTDIFVLFYILAMSMSWYNFVRAFMRSVTTSGRRRMGYLLVSSIAPSLGAFPFILFSSGFAARHVIVFWTLSVVINFLVGGLVVVMAYSVAFFGANLPDRTVKSRLFKWILRGPVVASLSLALTTIIRRIGVNFGVEYNAFVPITMVATILLGEYLITLFFPLLERWFLYGNDKKEIEMLLQLEERLITPNDLRQFLEAIMAALCDRLQAQGAYLVAMNASGLELIIKVGKTFFDKSTAIDELDRLLIKNNEFEEIFQWGEDVLVPLTDEDEEDRLILMGLLGIAKTRFDELSEDDHQAISAFKQRVTLALHDRRLQDSVFRSLGELSTKVAYIQQMRAAGRFDQSSILLGDVPLESTDMAQIVKDALTHYWGGPKLTESPLMRLKIVKEAINSYDGNAANALRSILRGAIDRIKPEGDRRFTGEWVLYNILDMKFLEGKKVREIALRLAMSEADLYRKQRIAIEAVAKAILDMEVQNGQATFSHKNYD